MVEGRVESRAESRGQEGPAGGIARCHRCRGAQGATASPSSFHSLIRFCVPQSWAVDDLQWCEWLRLLWFGGVNGVATCPAATAQVEPNNANSHYGLGTILMHVGRAPEAEQHWLKAC